MESNKKCGSCEKYLPLNQFNKNKKGEYQYRCITCAEKRLVKNKKEECITEGCKTRASFNYENENKSLYCNTHKQIGMVNVSKKNDKCIICNKKQPNFNFEAQSIPTH